MAETEIVRKTFTDATICDFEVVYARVQGRKPGRTLAVVTGQLIWPKGKDPKCSVWRGDTTPVNYANVILSDRQVYYIGQSPYNIWDRIDPANTETWRRSKWGWRMRKLHCAWTPDIATTPFREWTVIDDTMADGGTIGLGDSWLAPNGRLHVGVAEAPDPFRTA